MRGTDSNVTCVGMIGAPGLFVASLLCEHCQGHRPAGRWPRAAPAVVWGPATPGLSPGTSALEISLAQATGAAGPAEGECWSLQKLLFSLSCLLFGNFLTGLIVTSRSRSSWSQCFHGRVTSRVPSSPAGPRGTTRGPPCSPAGEMDTGAPLETDSGVGFSATRASRTCSGGTPGDEILQEGPSLGPCGQWAGGLSLVTRWGGGAGRGVSVFGAAGWEDVPLRHRACDRCPCQHTLPPPRWLSVQLFEERPGVLGSAATLHVSTLRWAICSVACYALAVPSPTCTPAGDRKSTRLNSSH